MVLPPISGENDRPTGELRNLYIISWSGNMILQRSFFPPTVQGFYIPETKPHHKQAMRAFRVRLTPPH
eukprot:6179538-Pleurochrysis_carterae.AAC.2